MVDPIRSSGVPMNNLSIPNPTPAKPTAQPEVISAKADVVKADTVELSYAAQALQLRQQGLSIPQIAYQLRLDVKTVTSYFPLSE